MTRTLRRRRRRLVLLLSGALLAALPTTAVAAQTPIDPALPTPTVPNEYGCGSDGTAWITPSIPSPAGVNFDVGIPRPTLNGQKFQGVVHLWDLDGSQSADGATDQSPVPYQGVYVPLSLADGHSYGWYASTFDGTSYSEPTGTCYFTVDGSGPTVGAITNPDLPQSGSPGRPKKAVGQSTTFTFSGAETLPAGCTTAAAPDCQASGLDHFVYSFNQAPGSGDPEVVPGPDGKADVTINLTSWGTATLYVSAVDAAGRRSQPLTYSFYVPSQLPPPASTTVNLSAPAASPRALGLTVTGWLTYGPYDVGGLLHVRRTDPAHPAGVALPDVPLAADGSFRITDHPGVGGANTYTVSYPGDADHLAATGSATVQVSRRAASLSLATDVPTYAYGAAATVTAHLGPTYDGRTVQIWAQPAGGKKTLVKSGSVDSQGNLRASWQVTRATTFTAAFAGDQRYAPAGAARSVQSYAGVTGSQSGYYTSTHYGSTLYRVYHHTATEQLNVSVAPNKAGQCVIYRLEQYSGGAWHTLSTTSCAALGSASTASHRIGLSHAAGGRFRVAAGYLHSSDDSTNLSTWGSWQYFTVVQ
ncbi:hypothetical protein [Peterkaempfera sp. SMS 1(5)a]|uniref:hypothetical protein n=1 Tax=Peterkaempfera podocarpi TaxID=3232308 RepID=UPI003671AD99